MSRIPQTIYVVGTSGSGKTTTIEYLTNRLTRLGFRVGVVKHIHKDRFTFDAEGKDTWRHAKAGAELVIGVSPNELAFFKKTAQETRYEHVAGMLGNENLDLAIVEGFSTAASNRKNVFKIITAKNPRDLRGTLSKNRPPILAITGRIAEAKGRVSKTYAPMISIRKDGPMLISTVRRVLRPQEIGQIYQKARLAHGGACIGLAVGVRAAYLAWNTLGDLSSNRCEVTCGAKHCIAEAFQVMFPKARVLMLNRRNDQITVKVPDSKLIIKLAPKKRYSSPKRVFEAPDNELFRSVRLTPQHASTSTT